MANLAHSMVELSEFQIGYIFGATEFGATQAAITNKVGCSQNMVSRILHRYDAETFTTRHKWSGPQRKQINTMIEE
jgi:CRP-like cAMP-binding protein